MYPEIVVPVLMSCALLWWIGRGMGWTTRLMVATITLVVIVAVFLVAVAVGTLPAPLTARLPPPEELKMASGG